MADIDWTKPLKDHNGHVVTEHKPSSWSSNLHLYRTVENPVFKTVYTKSGCAWNCDERDDSHGEGNRYVYNYDIFENYSDQELANVFRELDKRSTQYAHELLKRGYTIHWSDGEEIACFDEAAQIKKTIEQVVEL